ncbi:MAG: hypothetical protein KA914_09635 [Ottowia sp.]|nr:hypothetical protein [Ottowia sp.]MBP7453037.1 hypothetical protein [Ottowia sp.]
MEKASQTRGTTIRTLRDDEVKEVGREAWQPWHQRKCAGQEANCRILVQCDDTQRLYEPPRLSWRPVGLSHTAIVAV